MLLYDCHVHTNHSLDARYPMEQMLCAAADRGLAGVAFTDHADIDFYAAHHVKERMQLAVEEMLTLREAWRSRIELIVGVEIGQALYLPGEAQQIIDRGGYDFVIGAVHSVRNMGGFYSMAMGGATREDIDGFLRRYFGEVAETVETTDFDTLPHLTYPLRYIRQAVDFPVDYAPYEAAIRRIMAVLADRGKAYELNLKPYSPGDGSWRREEVWLLELFRQVGGSLITLGTDAHVPEKVGYGLEAGAAMLREAGFDRYHIYRQRKPCPVLLDGQ